MPDLLLVMPTTSLPPVRIRTGTRAISHQGWNRGLCVAHAARACKAAGTAGTWPNVVRHIAARTTGATYDATYGATHPICSTCTNSKVG